MADATLRVGEVAPDFTLLSTAGGEVTLSSLRGQPVLLAFFPLAFTRTCTAELCDFSKELPAFDGVRVLGISVDMVPSLKAFQAKEGITVDLLSDSRRDVSRKYGVMIEEKNHSKRAYFLVDGKGTLRWSHVEAELGHKRENAELLRQIAAVK